MPNQGKLVIGSIVGVALIAAGLSWWFTYQQGRRVLALWGAEAAYRIRLSQDCELWALELAAGTSPDLLIDDRPWTIVQRVTLNHAPGFVHARQALIGDSSYRWDVSPPSDSTSRWTHAVRFRDERGETTLVFDLDRGQVLDVAQGRRADISPIKTGLETYFREQLANQPVRPADPADLASP